MVSNDKNVPEDEDLEATTSQFPNKSAPLTRVESKDDSFIFKMYENNENLKRSKTDPKLDFIKVMDNDEEDTEICYQFYGEKESPNLEYNYHDFSHSTWYDFTKMKTPLPSKMDSRQCDDIRLCLPLHVGILLSLRSCVSGILSGWGFTHRPRRMLSYYLKELLNGILCGITMLPEVISFSFIAGIPIHVALHGSWIMCICATIFGGSPGIVTGLSGAFAAVAGTYALNPEDSSLTQADYDMCLTRLLVALMAASILLLIFSFIHMASLSQFLSTSVIIGYSNGLAIIIAKAQLHGFHDFSTGKYLRGANLYLSILYCIIAFIIAHFSHYIPKIGKYIPSALVAILVVIIIHYSIVAQVAPEVKISTVGSVANLTWETSFPAPLFLKHLSTLKRVKFDFKLVKQVLILTTSIMIEMLIIADIVKTLGAREPNSNQQLFALGIGNMLSSMLGSMGGSSMVGITIMNLKSGSKGKESSLITSLFVFIMMAGGYPILNYIPIPSLCGIMLNVSYHCFKWFSIPMVVFSALPGSIRSLHPRMKMKVSRYDAFIILAVTIMCVLWIVPLAVLLGIVFAAFAYVWESKSKFKVEIYYDREANIKYYEVEGNIFYASKRMLTRSFTPTEDPPTTVIVLLASTSLFDYTAIEALNSLKALYASYNKCLLIKGLSTGCIKKVAKMNRLCRHMEHDLVGFIPPSLPTLYSPFYEVASSIIDRAKVSGLLQERVERQSGLKVHELHSYPFLHKLPLLPDFVYYTSGKERSLILPFLADIRPSSEKSDSKPINLDEINLCDTEYFRLNRCVIEGLSKDNKDMNKPKFNRLSKCKYHYIIYDKCINRRNKTIDKIVYKYEMDHLNGLPSNKKTEYLEGLEKVVNEVKSKLEDSTDQTEKFALNRSLKLLSDRFKRLKKTFS